MRGLRAGFAGSVLSLALCAALPGQERASPEAKRALASAELDAEPEILRRSLPLTRGMTRAGVLRATDSVLRTGSLYHLYRYRVTRGETIDITLSSTAFDAALFLIRPKADGGDVVLVSNDDWEDGTDARITWRAQATEDVAIVVTSAMPAAQGFGAYRLKLTSKAPVNWASLYPGGGSPSGKYALVVGINDYPGEESDLEGPREDAEAVATLLVERFGFLRRNIVVLTDSAATRERVIQAFSRHLGQAGPEGSAVFYYSGHGMQLEGNEGLGPDVDPEPDGRDEALFLWGGTEVGTTLLDDELGAMAQRLKTKRTLLILDACYSGTGSRNAALRPKRVTAQSVGGALQTPKALGLDSLVLRSGNESGEEDMPEGHVLLSASSSTEVSWATNALPDNSGAGSIFTWILVKAILASNAGMPLDSLMRQVRDETVAFAEDRYGVTQTPQVEGTQSGLSLRDFLGDTVNTGGSKGVIPYRRRARPAAPKP